MALSPRKIGEGLYQPLADINVTPLVDVMLVLLIIFMVTAPMLATGIKVNLPSAKTAQPLDNREPVVVAVAKGRAPADEGWQVFITGPDGIRYYPSEFDRLLALRSRP